jgi:hypothetical protein
MDILLRLLIAHIITDFFIQPTSWVDEKRMKTWKSKFLYLHVLLTGLVAWLFLWDWNLWKIALFIMITHLLIDVYKLMCCPDNLISYIFDQIYHIAILGVSAIYLTDGIDIVSNTINSVFTETKWLAIIAGYLAVTTPVGYLVGKATQKWRDELADTVKERDSLKDAGIWIGILERTLVVTFVLFNQLQAIGFLIAAKSILRFSDKSEDNPRKQTEYVLIGTLISFTIALFIGLIIKTLANL